MLMKVMKLMEEAYDTIYIYGYVPFDSYDSEPTKCL